MPETPKKERRQLNFDWVPPALYDAVRAKAQRDGISLRALVLEYLQSWVELKPKRNQPAADRFAQQIKSRASRPKRTDQRRADLEKLVSLSARR